MLRYLWVCVDTDAWLFNARTMVILRVIERAAFAITVVSRPDRTDPALWLLRASPDGGAGSQKPVKCILQPGGCPFTGIGHDTLNGMGPGVPIQFPVFRYLSHRAGGVFCFVAALRTTSTGVCPHRW